MSDQPMTGRPTADQQRHLDLFVEHRPTLLGAGYRVLGSFSDAEDVVQEVWLRWVDVELDEVRDPRSYLLRITTRLALNRVRTQQRRREDYVGPWLPEPIADAKVVGADEAVEVAESVSMAMLVVLETLTPLERAAFVLKEVFDLPYAEIATTLDRSEASVRQLAHRARSHVRARAPRQQVDSDAHRDVTEKFLAVLQGGSLDDLLSLMAPDVVLTTDGGGKKRASLRPIHGAETVVRFAAGVMARPDTPDFVMEPIRVNGELGMAGVADGIIDTLCMFRIEGGLIRELYVIRNPDKLTGMAPE